MKNELLIDELLQQGREAEERVRFHFSAMNTAQLNWQPAPTSWSIAQCLDHLVASHSIYFSDLEKITAGNYTMRSWEKLSPLSGLWGRLMKDQLKEKVKRKMKAPKKIQPVSNATTEILQQYYTSLAAFLVYISKRRDTDLDKTIITSPLASFITYSLGDAFQFLITHEHRHIDQAIRVKENEHFPK